LTQIEGRAKLALTEGRNKMTLGQDDLGRRLSLVGPCRRLNLIRFKIDFKLLYPNNKIEIYDILITSSKLIIKIINL